MNFFNLTPYLRKKSPEMFQIIANCEARVTVNCRKGTNLQLKHLELINLSVL